MTDLFFDRICPFVFTGVVFEYLAARVYHRKRRLQLMVGIGDELFLLLMELGKRLHNNARKDYHEQRHDRKTRNAYQDAGTKKFMKLVEAFCAVKKDIQSVSVR